MSRRALTMTASLAAAAIAMVAVAGCAPSSVFTSPTGSPAASLRPSPVPTASATAHVPAATATPSAPPAGIPTAPPAQGGAATCLNTSTQAFQQMMAGNGWVSWQPDAGSGAAPFAVFPQGAPAGAVVCEWGADPTGSSTNVIGLAWAPLTGDAAQSARAALAAAGYASADIGTGIAYTNPAASEAVYLFTPSDVRWASRRDLLSAVIPPDAAH